jgi:hypothetical protein
VTGHRLISLFSAVALLFTGAVTAVKEDDRVVGGMLMAAGLIVLGVWVALEALHEHEHRQRNGAGTNGKTP